MSGCYQGTGSYDWTIVTMAHEYSVAGNGYCAILTATGAPASEFSHAILTIVQLKLSIYKAWSLGEGQLDRHSSCIALQ